MGTRHVSALIAPSTEHFEGEVQRDADYYDVVLTALVKGNVDLKIKPLDYAGADVLIQRLDE